MQKALGDYLDLSAVVIRADILQFIRESKIEFK